MKLTKAITEYPTISTPLTLLFNLLVVSWWLEVGLRVPFLASIRFEFLLAALAGVVAVTRSMSNHKRQKDDNSDVIRWVVIYIVVLFLSLPLAADFDVAWDTFINRALKFAVLGMLISHYVVSPSTLRAYLLASFLAFFKIGQESFLGKITGSMIWENQGVPRLNGTQGTMFGHPNSLSGKTVSMLPFAWYVYPTLTARWAKSLVLIQWVFAINIILFTASRTGYLTFIAAAILIVLFSNRNKGRLLLLLVLVGFAAVTLVPQAYQDRFLSSFTGEEKEGHSADTRKGLFYDSIDTFLKNPLGIGAQCFPIVQANAGRNAQETHNLYTQILAETGIQGMFCFIALLQAVLRKAFRVRKRCRQLLDRLEAQPPNSAPEFREFIDTELRTNRLFFATTNAVIVFTITRLLLGVFGHDLFEIYWWIAAGLVMALHNLLRIAEKRCAEIVGSTP